MLLLLLHLVSHGALCRLFRLHRLPIDFLRHRGPHSTRFTRPVRGNQRTHIRLLFLFPLLWRLGLYFNISGAFLPLGSRPPIRQLQLVILFNHNRAFDWRGLAQLLLQLLLFTSHCLQLF